MPSLGEAKYAASDSSLADEQSLVSVSMSASSDGGKALTASTTSLGGEKACEDESQDESQDLPLNDEEVSSSGSNVFVNAIRCTKRTDGDTSSFRRKFCGSSAQLVYGIMLLISGIVSFIWTPLDLLMEERLRMTPGFPAYEWWVNPPDEVLLRLYVFNITNHESYLNGTDDKLNLEEIGPIVYREKLRHLNPIFNENSTLTYTSQRTAIFLPEFNKGIDMNASLYLPNLAVLGMSSYLHDASFFMKMGFKLLLQSHNSPVIVKSSIYDYLWNYTDPVLDTAQRLSPGLVPVKKMGILSRIYSDFTDENTVYIGGKWGDEKFFQLSTTKKSPYIPGYTESCRDKVTNSTEGVMYQQKITKKSILYYWRKTLCKVVPLYYDGETQVSNILAYKFNMSDDEFNRKVNDVTRKDCYKSSPGLKNGLSDVSKCYYDFPMAASFPHFYAGDPTLKDYVTGLKPEREKHYSYVIIEPLTGIPLEGCARSQSNLVIKPITGFGKDIDRFSDTVIPMFWAEYNQVSVPTYIYNLVYFTANVLPVLQIVFSTLTVIIGAFISINSSIYKKEDRKSLSKQLLSIFRRQKLDNLARNTILSYEKETFIRKIS